MTLHLRRSFGRSLRAALAGIAGMSMIAVPGSGSALQADVGSESWATTYQVNASHDGAQPTSTLKPPLSESWRYRFDSKVSYALIIEGRIFVAVRGRSEDHRTPDQGARIFALDAESGRLLWGPVIAGTDSFRAGIAGDRDHIFVVNGSDPILALDPATGSLQWSRADPSAYFDSPPAVFEGNLYVGGSVEAGLGGGAMYAIDGQTGEALWVSRTEEAIRQNSPVVSEDAVFASRGCHYAIKWDRATGAQQWEHEGTCLSPGSRTAVLYRDQLFVVDPSADGVILDASTGSELGSFQAGPAPAFAGDVGIFPQADWTDRPGPLKGIDLTSKTTRWVQEADGTLVTAPVVTGGHVFVGGVSGLLVAIDPETGSITWSTNVGRAIYGPDEHNTSGPVQGLTAGEGMLLVPAGSSLIAFRRAPNVTLSSSLNPSTSQSAVTITATLKGEQQEPIPTGLVQFNLDGSPWGAPRVLDAGGTASQELDQLPEGTHVIAVSYAGDRTYGRGFGSLTQRVTLEPTHLQAHPVIVAQAQRIIDPRLRASLTTATGTPVVGRIIRFKVGNDPLCTAVTGSDGEASCDDFPSVARAVLTAGYDTLFAGDQYFAAAADRGPLLE